MERTDILFTLLKETDINDHVILLGKIDEKINNSLFKSDLDSVLLEIAKYKINKSIVHVINSFDFYGKSWIGNHEVIKLELN